MDHSSMLSTIEALLGPRDDWAALSAETTFRPTGSFRTPPPPPPVPHGHEDEDFIAHEAIGRGGMGVVFRATQTSLRRSVALKTLARPEDGEETGSLFRSDFRAEAMTGGRLEHPNIVPVYEAGRTRQGRPFFAMKLVGGRSWSEILRAGDKELRFHLETLLQVCNAIAFAHSKGVVHNDLKPSNVMIGAFGEVLVMDWGLATEFGPEPSGDLRHRSQVRGMCGTPAYMPPELANGEGADIGPWTDVYLLGSILYKLLCGRPPRSGSRFMDVMLEAMCGTVDPLPPGIPDELCGLVEQALHPEPMRRHGSVLEFQRKLRAYLSHEKSLDLAADARRRLDEVRARAASAGQVGEEERNALYEDFGAALAGFGQALRQWPENALATAGEAEARRGWARFALDQGDFGLAQMQVARLGPAEEGLARAVRRARRTQASERRLRRRLKLGMLLVVLLAALGLGVAFHQTREAYRHSQTKGDIAIDALSILTTRIEPNLRRGDAASQDLARDLADLAADSWGRLRDTDFEAERISRSTGVALEALGRLAMDRSGNLQEAREHFDAAHAILREAHAREPELTWGQLANLRTNIALLAWQQGRLEDGLVASEAALELIRPRLGPADKSGMAASQCLRALNMQGHLFLDLGHLADAEEVMREALTLVQTHGSAVEDRMTLAVTQHNLADALWAQGDSDEARTLLRAALEVLHAAFDEQPNDHLRQQLAKSLSRNGDMIAIDGDFEGAEPYFTAARHHFAHLVEGNPTSAELRADYAIAISRGGELAREMHRRDEALALFEQASREFDQLVALDSTAFQLHTKYARVLDNIANVRLESFDIEGAIEAAQLAREITFAFPEGVDAGRLRFAALATLTDAYLQAGRQEEARPVAEECLELTAAGLTEEPSARMHSDHAQACLRLAQVEQAAGNPTLAVELFVACLAARREAVSLEPTVLIHAVDLVKSLTSFGGLLLELGRPADAMPVFDEALEVAARQVDERRNRLALSTLGGVADAVGAARLQIGDLDGAAEAFLALHAAVDELIEIDPDNDDFRFDLSYALWRRYSVAWNLGAFSQVIELAELAIAILEEQLAKHPGDPSILATLEQHRGAKAEGERRLREARLVAGELEPAGPEDHLALALAALPADTVGAYEHFARALGDGWEPPVWEDHILAARAAALVAESSGDTLACARAWDWLAAGLARLSVVRAGFDAQMHAAVVQWLRQIRDEDPSFNALRGDARFAELVDAGLEALE